MAIFLSSCNTEDPAVPQNMDNRKVLQEVISWYNSSLSFMYEHDTIKYEYNSQKRLSHKTEHRYSYLPTGEINNIIPELLEIVIVQYDYQYASNEIITTITQSSTVYQNGQSYHTGSSTHSFSEKYTDATYTKHASTEDTKYEYDDQGRLTYHEYLFYRSDKESNHIIMKGVENWRYNEKIGNGRIEIYQDEYLYQSVNLYREYAKNDCINILKEIYTFDKHAPIEDYIDEPAYYSAEYKTLTKTYKYDEFLRPLEELVIREGLDNITTKEVTTSSYSGMKGYTTTKDNNDQIKLEKETTYIDL